jgi:transcriptional regulator with XRE-family HTH domain
MITVVGHNIRRYRKLKGLTIEKLGFLCDTDPRQISAYENGKVDINLTMLCLIAKKLEIEPAALLQLPPGEKDTFGDDFPKLPGK